MSFEAAIGRIDQILQMQQQIFDPSAGVASASSFDGGVGTSSAASGTGSASSALATDFATALASAQAATGTQASPTSALSASSGTTGDALGQLISSLYPLTSGTSSSTGAVSPLTGTSTSVSDPRLQAMVNEANSLVGKPYIWGGGHSNWATQPGYDCSGFVSAVLHAGGYLSSPQDTTTLPSASGIEPGPGQYVTIYDRDASGQEGHVIIDLNGQFYESGGEAGSWGGGGGVEKIATPSASYLATFNDILHPSGL